MIADRLNATFAALADPTRRAILARLAGGERTVGELAQPFELSLPTISRHLRVLEHAKLIAREKDAQWRRCRLQPGALAEAATWISRYQTFWSQQLDALVDYVARAPTKSALRRSSGGRGRGAGPTIPTKGRMK